MTFPPAGESGAPIASRANRSRRRTPWWVVAALVVLLGGGGIVAALVLTGHKSIIPLLKPTRAAFTFQMGDVSTTSLGGKRSDAVGNAAAEPVRTTLSDLYGGLFLDPKAWSSGPPSDVWDHFTEHAAEQAKSDGAALGLGELTGTIDTLKVASSNLEVHALSDRAGAAIAVMAKVEFVANATTKDGQHIQITREAQYLLEEVDGTWLVSGYPKSLTSVATIAPSAGPSGSSGSGGSA
jgi:hypothetical protein